jgi:hypothetical protein
VQRALEACRDAELHDRRPDGAGDGVIRTRVTWADALGRLCDAALTGLAGDRPAGDRHQVILHVRADDPAAPTHLHLGPAVPAAVRRSLSCDSTVRYLLEDAGGVPLALGRKQRSVSSAQRTQVEHRYAGRCAAPGCERHRGLHVHHLRHWEDGGTTDLANLVPLCGAHHRLHHLGHLGIRGDGTDPASLVFTDHHGLVLDPRGRAVLPDPGRRLGDVAGDLGVPPPRWQHPPGDRLDTWWITFRDPPGAAA